MQTVIKHAIYLLTNNVSAPASASPPLTGCEIAASSAEDGKTPADKTKYWCHNFQSNTQQTTKAHLRLRHHQ